MAVIHEDFMDPLGLEALYLETRLNVHPPLYDAYGMTVVEAAAFGVPSGIPPFGEHLGTFGNNNTTGLVFRICSTSSSVSQ